MTIIDKSGRTHEVAKYVKDKDGQEHIWCNDWYGHHIIGNDCEWLNIPAPHPGETPQKVLRWVKASERLPKNAGSPEYHFRFGGLKVNGNFHYSIDDERCEGEIVFTVLGGGCFQDYIVTKERFHLLEWLEEYEAPAAQPVRTERDNMCFAFKAGCIHGARTGTSVGVVPAFDEWYKKVEEVSRSVRATETLAPGEVDKCLCVEKAGDHAGCNFPHCDKYNKEAVPTQQGEVPEEISIWIKEAVKGIMAVEDSYNFPADFGEKVSAAMYHRDQEQIKALQSQIEGLHDGLREIHKKGITAYMTDNIAPELAGMAADLLKKYPSGSK